MRKHIPNSITCCNLICGCIATGLAFHAMYFWALTFIILGAVFDFFDGFTARLLHVSSPIGKELDSLADVITFGFAPAAIIGSVLREAILLGHWQWPVLWNGHYNTVTLGDIIPYVAFLMAAFSALRLAKFNLDERQSMGFIGMPTPANALFWASLSLGLYDNFVIVDHPMRWAAGIIVMMLVSCWLLVCEVPMFALKFHDFKWKGNELRFSFIAASVALLVGFALFGMASMGVAAVIVLYVILSVVSNWHTSGSK